MRALLLAALLVGCGTEAPEPEPKPVAKAVDLDALAARRASTSGAGLEAEAAQKRSAGAKSVYASKEGEKGLVEFEDEVGGEVAARAAIAGADRGSFSAPGSSGGPSDADMASDGTEPWVNMDLVSTAIRRRQKSIQGCWDTVAMDAPSLGKRVLVKITVDTHGGGDVRLAPGSPTRHPELISCLIATMGRVDYPEAKNASVTFEYPLNF
jgi:hypothetical protein